MTLLAEDVGDTGGCRGEQVVMYRGGRMRRFYEDEGMNFAVLLSLGFAYANVTDVGETLATIERIPDGDGEAWVREWEATADRLASLADESLRGGHTVSGRARLLRASTYFDHASSMAPGSEDPSRYT